MFKKSSRERRVAVLLSGVPKVHSRCIDSLRFLLEDWNPTFFAVLREEFATPETIASLEAAIPQVKIIVVPSRETQAALVAFRGQPIASTVVMMWHEIWYAAKQMGRLENFDLALRTRFDIFFHRQYLPELTGRESDVWLPSQLSWSGANDMICLAEPRAFLNYADTYQRLSTIVDERIGIPEMVMARSLALAGLSEQNLEVYFVLYRDALFSSLSDAHLGVLAHLKPDLSTYKLGAATDTPERREQCVNTIKAVTRHEVPFPLHETRNAGFNFYPVEIDARDGSAFRWMSQHAHLNRAIGRRASGICFKIHFRVAGWDLSRFTLLIDGSPIKLEITATDEYGRSKVFGSLEGIARRRPWSKICFSSKVLVVPAQVNANSRDQRPLSIAIGSFEILD